MIVLEAVQKEWLPKSLLLELLNDEPDADSTCKIVDTLTDRQRALFAKLLVSFREQLEESMED